MLQNAPRAARERFGKPKNERRAAWERSSPKLVPQNDPPENTPNHLFYNVFCTFLEIHRSTHFVPKKNGPPQVDAQERPRRSHETYIFKAFFAIFVLRACLGGRPRRGLHFQNMQYYIGFINVLDALTGSMLGPLDEHQKSENERHAAWERSFAKKSARHCSGNAFQHNG